MALSVMSIAQLRLEVVLEPGRTGDSVEQVCRRRGISRQTFYVWRRRFEAEGLAGLESRPRTPAHSPGRMEPGLEALICRLRSERPRWGARRIRAELARAGTPPPAVSTIHQALRRNHLVAARPARRRRADKRFERPLANDLWQIDATRVVLAGGRSAWIVDCLDDHARFLLAARACESPSGEAAWQCFLAASAAYGLPRQLLSDNHTSFTGRLFGVTVAFERRLAGLGVELINARPAHPETLGKLERFHRTLKEWLADEGSAGDLAQLQALLDRFRLHYNQERPHQGIQDLTPAERYHRTAAEAHPAGRPLAEPRLGERGNETNYPAHSIIRTVKRNGVLTYNYLQINIGIRFAGAKVRIVESGAVIHIYHGDDLVRTLAPDPGRCYQPLGRRRGKEVEIRP